MDVGSVAEDLLGGFVAMYRSSGCERTPTNLSNLVSLRKYSVCYSLQMAFLVHHIKYVISAAARMPLPPDARCEFDRKFLPLLEEFPADDSLGNELHVRVNDNNIQKLEKKKKKKKRGEGGGKKN